MHDTNLLENQPIAWTPTPEVIERSQLMRFMRQVGVETWDELYQFSIRDVEKFTEEVLKFLDIKFDPPYEKLLDASNGIEFPEWFSTQRRRDAKSEPPAVAGGLRSAGLNITEMCLDGWQTDEMKDQPAVIWEGENGSEESLSYVALIREVEYCSGGLRMNGIGKGDAVAIHLPMTVETVVALMAIGRIGAIAVPVFSGYGVEAIASRINAVGAKALITCDGFERRGKAIDARTIGLNAVKRCPTIEHVFIVYRLSEPPVPVTSPRLVVLTFSVDPAEQAGTSSLPVREHTWKELLGVERLGESEYYPFQRDSLHLPEPTSAEDPLIILYTSGTTGKPKGIAHTHASFPIKAAQDMAFGTDVGKGTRICWYTDIGWMMGPWLIYGALINGATICIYDGAPDFPTPDRMWEFCAKHKVEVLGISPTLVRSLARNADASVRESAKDISAKTETPNPQKGWHSRGYLPHFDGDVTQFVTFRLADSLPQSVLRRIEHEIEIEKPEDASRTLLIKVEEYLDSGIGECILRQPEVAAVVQETILNEHGKTCRVDAWVIMPNHAHVLLRPNEGVSLSTVMKSIKSVSSHKINKLLGRSGAVWQPDYFDRYIRDENHYAKTFRYIENNPVKAGFCSEVSEWPFSSARMRTPSSLETRTPSSARVADILHADEGVRVPPHERYDLSSLRMFASTGEPWNPAPWWWLFEKVGNSKLPIINYSGGTEIAGGILMGNPLLPQKPCSFPAPCLGMDVDILDENGKPVGPNQVGELVIKQPWIGMARGFWQEKDRYLETYWRRFKNIWVHGDWAMRDNDGHWFILGRSDDTLKVAGKRVGPAEVESLLVAHPLVTEAAVIGVPDETKGTAMVAFCVLSVPSAVAGGDFLPQSRKDAKEEKAETRPVGSVRLKVPDLEKELKALVAKDMGKPLAPSRIHFVLGLPKTRNAKVMRRVIRSAYLGEDPGDLSALEDPKTVDEIAAVRDRS